MFSFISGGNTGVSPESLARRRALIRGMLENAVSGQAPQSTGEALLRFGTAIVAGIKNRQLDKDEQAVRSSATDAFNSAIGGFLLGGGTPTAAPDYQSDSATGNYFASIRAAESGGNDAAKNPTSSAQGRYQFTTGTWANVAKKHPELGLTADGRLDPAQQEKAIRAFTSDNASVLSSAGVPVHGGSLYAAHFLGAGGAKSVFSADPSTPIGAVVGSSVLKANPFLNGMSVGDFQKWAARKAQPPGWG